MATPSTEMPPVPGEENKSRGKFYREFIVRIAIIVMVAALSLSANHFINSKRLEHFTAELGSIAESMANSTDMVFAKEAARIQPLADDPRLEELTSDSMGPLKPEVRRVLYEFSLINDLDDVYLFDPARSDPIASTAGALPLPEDAVTLLYGAYRDSQPTVAMQATIEGTSFIFIAQKSRIAPVYLAYLIEPKILFSQIQLPALVQAPDAALSIFIPTVEGQLHMMSNMVRSIGRSRLLSTKEALYPKQLNVPQQYQAGMGRANYFIGMAPLNSINGWAALALLDERYTKEYLKDWQQVIKWFFILITLLALFWPTKGAYSEQLKKVAENTANLLSGKGINKAKNGPAGGIRAGHTPGAASFTIGEQTVSLVQDEPTPKHSVTLDDAATEIVDKPKSEPDTTPEPDPEKAPATAVDEEAAQQAELKEAQEKLAQRMEQEQEEQMLDLIDEALRRRRTKLLYQPIVRSDNGKVLMYEVFLRLLDEELEEISPAQFIPVAEENNLMAQIDRYVTLNVIERHMSFGTMNPPKLIINLAGNTMDSVAFLQALTTMITSQNLPAHNLIFELKADEVIKDKNLLEFLRDVRKAGCKFSIDYYGGGQKSLELIQSMRFDYVKLDALKFPDWETNVDTKKELIRISMMAQKMRLPLVMERVETPELIAFAKKIGIPALQGYGIARPEDSLVKEITLPQS